MEQMATVSADISRKTTQPSKCTSLDRMSLKASINTPHQYNAYWI